MKIGILGTGDVGRALGKGFLALGNDVMMGARTAGNEKARAWVAEVGIASTAKAMEGSFADAAKFGDVIVVATLGSANPAAVALAEPRNFAGKLVIDTTNPLDLSGGFPPKLAVTPPDASAGEQLQRLLPGAFVVKAFNTVGHAHMFRPDFPGGPPDMFICGDAQESKAHTAQILEQFGWGTVDVGGIAMSRHLEAMCIVWVGYGARTNTWNHAFKLLRK
jgi:predicted dinucleotide-binding enzyme